MILFRPIIFTRLVLVIAACALWPATRSPALASDCTLADHIRSANTNTAVGFCPAGTSHDIITITEDITLSEALPPITGTITIEGGGHTISGDGKFRIFDVSGGRLTLRGLTLEMGKATEGSGGFPYFINNERVLMDAGGALRLDGGAQVLIENTSLSGNSADVGGAIALLSGKLSVDSSSFVLNKSSEYDGGAIFMRQGAVTIINSSFVDNSASWSGGALGAQSGSITVANSTFQDNVGPAGGGVLYISGGDATLTHLTMLNNRTSSSGAAVANSGGSINLRNSIIAGRGGGADCVGGLNQNSGNWSEDGTCAFMASEIPLLGKLTGSPAYLPLLDGSPALNAANPDFCLPTDQIGTPRPYGDGCDIGAIESTTALPATAPIVPPPPCPLGLRIIAANTDAPAGGCPAGSGRDVITLTEDINLAAPLPSITSEITIEGNGFTISGDSKLRIFDVDGGELTIHDLTLTKGYSTNDGGAILVKNGGKAIIENAKFVRNHANYGGAIATIYPSRGVTINRSEFSHNLAKWSGGAIQKRGGDILITNSSFVRNVAGTGGAIDTASPGKIDITNSSFINNSGRPGGAVYAVGAITTLTHVTMLNNSTGIWIYDEDQTVNMRNSLIVSDRIGADCWGRLTQNFGNIIQDGSCAPAISGDPLLDEPSGSPATVSLQEGSAAIDAADPRFCPATDQIGAARPQGGGCDIGAIESTYGSPARAESPSTSEAGAICQATTTHTLNFRDGPNGNRIGLVRQGETLERIDRTAGWIRVAYRGATGWISADYVVTQGDCD